MRVRSPAIAFSLALLAHHGSGLQAQHAAARPPTGRELSALPSLAFDADEGFGYGAGIYLYDYGPLGASPYRYTVQPKVFLTTRGRRDVSVFVDAPHLLPGGWRIGGYAAREQQLATPYYGVGNNTVYDTTNERGGNPYFYRYGRTSLRLLVTAQRPVHGALRVLIGGGVRSTTVTTVPYDSGTSLLARETGGAGIPRLGAPFLRGGLVYDTRDREIGPTRGIWAEVLGQHADKILGGTERYTRTTATGRGYISPWPRLTLAQRVILENVSGNVPIYEMVEVQSSYADDEGLGGSGTVRGVPRDRYTGKGMFVSNSEVRVRAADFRLFRRQSGLIVSGFLDAGRVWATGFRLSDMFSELHPGYGGGVRLAFGPSFVIAADVGHSSQSTAALYLGLGYLF